MVKFRLPEKDLFPLALVAAFFASLILILAFVSKTGVKSGGMFESASAPSGRHVVTLAENGFEPAHLLIFEGDTITFKTAQGTSFWPASNPHPSRDIIPTFDPGRPVNPGEAWTFRFDTMGEWGYHNHLNPSQTGRIDVVTGRFELREVDSEVEWAKQCRSKVDSSDLIQCWDESIKIATVKKGPLFGISVLDELRKDPDFAARCHDFTHVLGELSFWHYVKTGEFVANEQATFCSYGYYHGFLRALGVSLPVDNAFEICDRVGGKTLPPLARRELIEQCYLGIGQGLAVDYTDQAGSEAVGLEKAIERCKRISRERAHESNCIQGAYVGVGNLYTGYHGQKLPTKQEDPAWVCSLQEEKYRLYCFVNISHATLLTFNSDLIKAVNLYRKYLTEHELRWPTKHLAYLVSHGFLAKKNPEAYISDCHSLPTLLSDYCIAGVSQSVYESNTSQSQDKVALDFCQSGLLKTIEERKHCFRIVLYLVTRFKENPELESTKICKTAVEPDYQSACLGRNLVEPEFSRPALPL